jgi:transcriptional regulator with XRE-family HTH domain
MEAQTCTYDAKELLGQIDRHCKEEGISYTAIAAYLGLHYQQVAGTLKGKPIPNLQYFLNILRELDIEFHLVFPE